MFFVVERGSCTLTIVDVSVGVCC